MSWEDWVRRVERRQDKQWEINRRSERREGKWGEHEEVVLATWEIGSGKEERKGKSLGGELKPAGERFPGREGKGKGCSDEQGWWDDWWAMKELSGDDLDVGDLRQRLRDEQWDEMRSRKLRNASATMAECLGEEMASELRMPECW